MESATKKREKIVSLKIYLLQIFKVSLQLKFKRLNAGIFLILKWIIFIKKNTYFFSFLSITFIFKYFLNRNIQSLSIFKRNISWKFEVSSSKNEGKDGF